MKKDGKFRLGMIGAGIFAEANLYPSLSLHFFDDLERLAVCDLNEARATRLAGKYGWKRTYTNYDEMIAKEELDAAVVCVGAETAPRVACDVLEKGLSIFLEKPAGKRYEDTVRILEASRKAKKIVQIDHQKRYGYAWRRAREMALDKSRFGNIIQIESKQHGFEVFPTFYTCMLEWQSHNLDVVQSFCGDITQADAWVHLVDDRHGALVGMLRFEGGAVGNLAWGTYGGPGQFTERVEVIGDRSRGVVITNSREVTLYEPEAGTTWAPDWNPITPNQSHIFNGYVPGLRAFIDCVRNGTEPVPSIETEAKTMYWLEELAKKAGIPIEWGPVSSAL